MHELNGQPHLDKVAPILGTLTLKDYSIRPQKQQKRKKEKGKTSKLNPNYSPDCICQFNSFPLKFRGNGNGSKLGVEISPKNQK